MVKDIDLSYFEGDFEIFLKLKKLKIMKNIFLY